MLCVCHATPQDPAGAASQWSSSLFNSFFDSELDTCPEDIAGIYGDMEQEGGIVTLDDLTSNACGDWLEYDSSCYFKSSFLESSTSWEDAGAR